MRMSTENPLLKNRVPIKSSIALKLALVMLILMHTVSYGQELPVISVESLSPTVEEGRQALFKVSSDRSSEHPLSVRLKLTGDIFEILDYLPKELQVNLAPEQMTFQVELITLDDAIEKRDGTIILSIVDEEPPNETFRANSSSASAEVLLIEND